MPKRTLYLKCHLHEIERLYIDDPASYEWKLKLKCTRCSYVTKNWVSVVSKIFYEKPYGGMCVNYYKECKICRYKATLRDYHESLKSQWQPIVTFECRGVEPVGFMPAESWAAISTKGMEFNGFDLTKKMWTGIDPSIDNDGGQVRIRFTEATFAPTSKRL